jgi:hypothetical protein
MFRIQINMHFVREFEPELKKLNSYAKFRP